MSPKRVSDRVSMVIPSPFGGVQLGDHTIDVLTVKRQTEPVRGAIHAQFGDLAGEEGFEPSIPCSRGRCLTVRLLANATRPPEYRISAPDGERPRATNIRSSAAISCGIVVFGHRKGVETKRHTTLPLIGSRRERFAEAAREGVFLCTDKTRRWFAPTATRSSRSPQASSSSTQIGSSASRVAARRAEQPRSCLLY